MNWPIRLLICGVTMLAAIKTAFFTHPSEGRWPFGSSATIPPESDRWGDRPRELISDSRLVSSLAPAEQSYEFSLANTSTHDPSSYKVIAERNGFCLKPIAGVTPQPLPAIEPKQDLILTGLVGFSSSASALFMITEPAKPPSYFTLHEGEQNEWLEVRSIDLENGTVKAILRRPVVRIRNAGTEVILSFQTHGAKN